MVRDENNGTPPGTPSVPCNLADVRGRLSGAGLDVVDPQIGTQGPVLCPVIGGGLWNGWYAFEEIELGAGRGKLAVGSFGRLGADASKAEQIPLPADADVSPELRHALDIRHRSDIQRAAGLHRARSDRAAAAARRVMSGYRPADDVVLPRSGGLKARDALVAPNGPETLALPLRDTAGRVWSLFLVRGADRGRKPETEYFPRGHWVRATYHKIGHPTEMVLIVTGYPSGLVLSEATGLHTLVVLRADNLLPVAEAYRAVNRRVRLLICADDSGQAQAVQTAAVAVSGAWVAADFPGRPGGGSWNELYVYPDGGLAAVRDQVHRAIHAAGWDLFEPASAPEPPSRGKARERSTAESMMEIEDLAKRFIPIDDGTGKSLWDSTTRKVVNISQMLALLPPKGRLEDIKAVPLWRLRGAVYPDQIGFDPSGKDPNVVLNTWGGWPMEPREGSCQLLLELIEYLCSGPDNSPEMAGWVLDWMACPLQHPGTKMASAIIMHGPQGSGKSAVWQTYSTLYGDYSTILNQRGLEDRFNSDWIANKLFLLAEEVVTRSEMWHVKNELKELITGDKIRINEKFSTAAHQRNHLNIVFLSNENQPLPLESDDRRHAVVYTPAALPQICYDELFAELDNGGVAAFYHFLLKRDLSNFRPNSSPPLTPAKMSLIGLAKPSEARFVDEWMSGETPYPFGPALGMDVYAGYLRWCRLNGIRYPRESNHFLHAVGKRPGWVNAPRWIYDTTHYTGERRKRRILVPSDTDLRAAGVGVRPENKTIEQWLTDCYLRFQIALENATAGSSSGAN